MNQLYNTSPHSKPIYIYTHKIYINIRDLYEAADLKSTLSVPASWFKLGHSTALHRLITTVVQKQNPVHDQNLTTKFTIQRRPISMWFEDASHTFCRYWVIWTIGEQNKSKDVVWKAGETRKSREKQR